MNLPMQVAAGAEQSPQAGGSLSRTIAEFSEHVCYEDIPARVRRFAKFHILDVVGVSLAAVHYDFAYRALAGTAGTAGRGDCTVIGLDARLPLKDAALVNGILAHGLDYDDSHPGGPVHPSASAFPCALGLGEYLDRSGQELVTAYLLGVEVATRLGIAAHGSMHKSGFHTTGIAGHLGCAVAAGRLFNLNAHQLTSAQGLAGSTASAIGEFRAEGAWSKRMHAGWAAAGGIAAASLARSGFIGPQRVYEGSDGLFRSHAGVYLSEVNLAAMTSELGDAWRAEEVAVKPFPICHILHACVDAALVLRKRHGLAADDIVEARALLHPDTFNRVCEPQDMRRRPASEYVAKFSVFFTIAAALVRGKCGFAELEPEVIGDAQILSLAERVTYAADPNSRYPDYFSGGIVIRLRDGQILEHLEPVNRGAGERALTEDEIAAKFMDNAQLVVSRARAECIRDCIIDIDRHSAREVALMLRG